MKDPIATALAALELGDVDSATSTLRAFRDGREMAVGRVMNAATNYANDVRERKTMHAIASRHGLENRIRHELGLEIKE